MSLTHLSELSKAIKDDTGLLRTHRPVIQSDIHKIQQDQDSASHRRLLDWKSPTAYPAEESDIMQRRHDGTGPWFHEKTGEREKRWKGEKRWKEIMENRWRDGRCFNCGSGAHWENDCPDSCGKCATIVSI